MATSPVEIIKEKLDLIEFLRGYLNLQPAGKNFKALCPFHKEKTPSFMISPERQNWHCFGCSLGGDIFSFLMRYENLEFGEALKILAERAGVELRRLSPADYKYFGILYDINSAAKDFFKKQLVNSDPAQKYLVSRGLRPETIEEFEIGWAAKESEILNLYLLNIGYQPEDIIRAGLAIKTEKGLQFDRFRGRLMFPIHNHLGKVVGFTGRILPEFDDGKMGKYINSPETPIFNKSRLLYGLFKSKNAVREQDSVFLVEGQMDFLMSYQGGTKNTAATSGTALTLDHLKILRRLSNQIVLSFDNDEAGWAAGERAIDLAAANDFNVKIIDLKDYKDPAEAVQADPEFLKVALKESQPAMEFYFKKYKLADSGVSDQQEVSDFKKRLRLALIKIKGLASAIEQSYWLKKLAQRSGFEENVLAAEMDQIEIGSVDNYRIISEDEQSNQNQEKHEFSRQELIGRKIIGFALARNDHLLASEVFNYLPASCQEILNFLPSQPKSIADPRLNYLLNQIYLEQSVFDQEEFKKLKLELIKGYFREQRRLLTTGAKQAEAAGDLEKLKAILQDLDKSAQIESEELVSHSKI